MIDWTDEELEASVLAYRRMELREAEKNPYSKKAIYRELEEQFPRTAKAFEYRMQDISAVLQDAGAAWISGLKPAVNVGANVAPRLGAMLKKHGMLATKKGTEARYKVKLSAMRDWLIQVARRGEPVTYAQVMEAFDIDRFSLRFALGYLGRQAENLDEPILTAMVVNKASGRCGPGFAAEFQIDDDRVERQRLFEHWSTQESDPLAKPTDTTLEQRTARFVSVEARPDQAAFRKRVFKACAGRCVISGCDILPTLDAAHKRGRSWKAGHNTANDGFVMRKDLHALYDAGLLCINQDGVVSVDAEISEQYGNFSGTKIAGVIYQSTS